MPSLRQLQYLVALGQTGHFRLAAEKVGVSQPTLSAQLLSLERRLGVQLVERGRAPVILTSAGQQILALAEQVAMTVQEIDDAAQSHRLEMSGVVRLGLPASIGPYLLPAILPRLHASYPELRLHVRENIPHALPDALAAGRHDLLIVPLPVRGDDFVSLRVFREPLYLAVPADNKLAERDVIELPELAGQPVLTLEKGHALHEQVRSICEECGARMLHDYEGTSLSTLHQMVAMGLGFTFLPSLYARSAVGPQSGIKLLTFRTKPLHRTVGLVWRKSSPHTQTHHLIARSLRDAVRQDFPDLMLLDG